MHNLKNTSYIFVPFMYDKQTNFKALVAAFSSSGLWKQVHDEIAYMFKYVADKIDSYDETACQCFHFELMDSCRVMFELATENDWFSTQPHSFRGSNDSIRFRIMNIQLYCFSTTVGIIAFKIHFEKDDPFWVANAQYYLKKVSREKIFLEDSAKATTILNISKNLVSKFTALSKIDFFTMQTRQLSALIYLHISKSSHKKAIEKSFSICDDAIVMASFILKTIK